MINLRDPAIMEVPRFKFAKNVMNSQGTAVYGNLDFMVPPGHFYIIDSFVVHNNNTSNNECWVALMHPGGGQPYDTDSLTANFLTQYHDTVRQQGFDSGGGYLFKQDMSALTSANVASTTNPIYLDEYWAFKVYSETDEMVDAMISYRDFY